MKKILCWFGFHKQGILISEMVMNVWSEGWDLYECARCGRWYQSFVESYLDKSLYLSTEKFLNELKSKKKS